MDPRVQLADWAKLRQKNPSLFMEEIRDNIITAPTIANPPFGKKKSIYTDFFASSKPLRRVEAIMAESVLPYYANTHTSTTSSSKSTSASVKCARETIGRCTNAITTPGHEHEAAIIFCGDGSTAAINKIRNVFRLGDTAYWIRKALSESISSSPSTMTTLSTTPPSHANTSLSPSSSITESESLRLHTLTGLLSPSPSSLYRGWSGELPEQHRPVVFLSIQEHHSNLLPWRESCADVVVIPEDDTTHQLDLKVLEQQLIAHQDRPLKLGTFSAGSNLTGVLNDTVVISELLHKYGAFAFYDFAGVGPYITIDMNPPPSSQHSDDSHATSASKKNLAYKDGVFISTHKFLGGPGGSGILVARLEVFDWINQHSATDRNECFPDTPGGGTVDMVIQGQHKYSPDVIHREEAGTPNILATIRTGLVFQLQDIVGPEWILQKEYEQARKIMARLCAPAMKERGVFVLGASERDRVAVFSLTVAAPPSRFRSRDQARPLQIHYALLSTIMNDFFGVEMRGGCMCAGPYASQLLNFDEIKEAAFWKLLLGDSRNNEKQDSRRPEGGLGGNAADATAITAPSTDSHHLKDKSGIHITNRSHNIHQQDLCSKSLKPGFVRFSFSYFSKDKDIEFVVQSLEWVAQYGYLLVPLYQLDARSGIWSVREAVRNLVLKEIPPKLKEGASREYCIPTAINCIHGLKRLFSEQSKFAPHSASIITSLHPPLLQVESVGVDEQNSRWSGSGVFGSLQQAKKSLVDLFSTGGSGSLRSSSSMTTSPTLSPPSFSLSLLRNESDHAIGSHNSDSEGKNLRHRRHHSTPMPLMTNNSSCDVSRTSPDQDGRISASSTTMSASTLGLPSLAHTITSSDSGSSSRTLVKKASFLSSKWYTADKDRQLMAEALKELAWDRLEAEVNAVEISELAMDLRWFVTPLEVARFYTQELATLSSSSSLFPKRTK
ncbi:hypothetical protein BGZ99_010028 [Dissophora globulifera]|uniref:Aminotransferase class V domain-containing protein n=1 Tax=Dissophora globulifera TaxID=979702 RepID=A0A9P6V0I9_9FUNG|nr:hypothetical protein BGZ99_010028 [Dissophora globulifera]